MYVKPTVQEISLDNETSYCCTAISITDATPGSLEETLAMAGIYVEMAYDPSLELGIEASAGSSDFQSDGRQLACVEATLSL